jgi:hypothetical protein
VTTDAKLDPALSPIIERTGAFVAITVIVLMGMCLLLPFLAAHYQLKINDADHAALSQIETTISNVFVAVVSFFFGASAGTRKKDEAVATLAATAAKAQDALPPVNGAAPSVPVEVGAKVVVEGVQHDPKAP